MQPCDFFREVPSGCRAYVMKHVIHDWDDERARNILANCRRAVPEDGSLLLVEWALPEGNAPSAGKFADVMMMLMTGGKERTMEEYRHPLGQAGFRLNQVISTSSDLNIIEALPCGWRIVNSRMIPRDSSSGCDCWPALPCTSQEAKCAYVGGPMEGIRFKDDCMNDC
jgi:hypothetical protein